MKELLIKVPTDLNTSLTSTKKLEALWNDLTPIARRDFITWVESAKQPETRARRIGITCDKLLSGKRRPCCYAVVPMNLYKALGDNQKAKAVWKDLTPDLRRDLVKWVDKQADKETKKHRVDKAITMLAKGKLSLS